MMAMIPAMASMGQQASKKIGQGMDYGANAIGDIYSKEAYQQYAGDMDALQKQIAAQLQSYYIQGQARIDPYEKTGQSAMNNFYNASQKMQDPTAFINGIMQNYQQSPFASVQRKQGMEDINSSAASNGLMGSTAQGRNLLNFSQDLTTKDQQQFLNNALGVNNSYLSNMGDMGHMGFQGATNIADLLSKLGMTQSDIASGLGQAKGQANAAATQSQGNEWGDWIGMAKSFLT